MFTVEIFSPVFRIPESFSPSGIPVTRTKNVVRSRFSALLPDLWTINYEHSPYGSLGENFQKVDAILTQIKKQLLTSLFRSTDSRNLLVTGST